MGRSRPERRFWGQPGREGPGGVGQPGAAGLNLARGLGAELRPLPPLQAGRLNEEAARHQPLPEVSVSRRDAPDGSATLSCRARGFDPRPVHVSWVRDGKETPAPPIGDASQLQTSVGIPQQAGAGHSYSCRVQHCGLQEALATPAPGEMGGLAPGILAALGLAALTGAGAALAGVVVWRRKRSDSGRSSFAPTAGHHSLSVLVTIITHEEDRTHHYFMITRLDDVQVLYYSSDTRKVRPTQPWAEQALGAEFFQKKTQEFLGYDEDSKGGIRRWMQLHNQTGGVHTVQAHVGCALSGQTPVDPRFQYAYDGGDLMRFDAQTGTWVAAVQPAVPVKQSWETGKTWTQYVQWLLQSECLEILRRLVQQGRAVLERQAPPTVSVSRRDDPDGSVTLSCRARGFYPRPIHVSWVRDGEDILAEKYSSGILPNDIHSYYTQSSLEISPQQEDGHRYACRVEHSSLGEPVLVWAPGKKGPLPPGVLAAIVLAVLVLAGAVGAGVILWRRKSGPYALAANFAGLAKDTDIVNICQSKVLHPSEQLIPQALTGDRHLLEAERRTRNPKSSIGMMKADSNLASGSKGTSQ
ncbi:class I histocompatibility antigen, F10 alpha chain-like [Mauremys reevesii]|uniref:class I histocompatibility antigen, F10 alpha chain-like n=1 Tax=Mauremys reevesii TaxID=260615 RepID=UPI00193FD476|nr:class I histocompatibility antigen, F10 alpha chain-like [Mauremys reevesii]